MRTILSIPKFARACGFSSSNEKGFRKDLNYLIRVRALEIQQSGFLGDSMHHHKIVVIRDFTALQVHFQKVFNITQQEVPEASFFFKGNYNWAVPSKFNLTGMRVEHDEDYGWLLKFQMSHQEAFKVYEFLFQHHPEFSVRYDENEGLKIEKIEGRVCACPCGCKNEPDGLEDLCHFCMETHESLRVPS